MSSCTTKENTPNVEYPATSKLDAEKMEPAKRDGDPPLTNKEGHENLVDNSKVVADEEMCSTRYFIIKSLNYENIHLSVERGIWATQVMNERILEEAFNNSRRVILIFSVNASGFFQGYAEMISSVGRRRDSIWSQGAGSNKPWGRSFKVKWLQLINLPFHKTLHLKNPLNEFKPVKISRDCQELPLEIGAALCELIDKESEEYLNLNRGISFGTAGQESGYSNPEEASNASSIDMTCGATSMYYPSFPHNYHSEPSSWHLANGSVPTPECLPVVANESAAMGDPERKGNTGDPRRKENTGDPRRKVNTGDPRRKENTGDPRRKVNTRDPGRKGNTRDSPISDVSSQVDSWPVSGNMSPFGGAITDDELLRLSYEEYFERFSGLARTVMEEEAARQAQRKDDSSSKERDSDNSHSHGDHVNSRKRSRH